jgi:GNAT superfamily N-acetyltransferase
MLLNSAGPLVDDRVVLGTGEPWEIFFFASEVVAGARKGHFNDLHGSMAYVLRKLGLICVKAILLKRIGRWAEVAPRFVVARRQGRACGAMLLKHALTSDGQHLLLIEYMAVAESARREGVGRMLVEYAKRRAPVEGVECYCTEASRGMQRLLKRAGFVRTHRSKELIVDGERLSVPSRWQWRA